MTAIEKNKVGLWTRVKALVVWLVASVLLATLRYKIRNAAGYQKFTQARQPVIFAFWHGQQLAMFGVRAGHRLTVMTSHSRDGEMQTRICRRFGFSVVRGSSSRGGLAGLLGLARSLREGSSLALTVDGPRGPAFVAKSGVVALARLSGAPIMPVAAAFRRKYEFSRAWDRFLLPLPFTRTRLSFGEPIQVSADTPAAELDQIAHKLTEQLQELTASVND